MRDNEIEILREKLNRMINSDDVSREDILKVSRELDVLIVRYIKKDNVKRLKLVKKQENNDKRPDKDNPSYTQHTFLRNG